MNTKLCQSDTLPAYRKKVDILSPLSGKSQPLSTAVDPIFRHGLLGDGVLIEPAGYQLIAPFDGILKDISGTAGQLRLTADSGLQLLIQLGFDSHIMLGDGFKTLLSAGKRFKQGQVLLEFNLNKMKQQLENVQCPVTLLNSDKILAITVNYYALRAGQDPLMSVYW